MSAIYADFLLAHTCTGFVLLIGQLAQLSALFNHQALFSLMQKMVAVRTHFTLLLRFFEQIDVDNVILHNSIPYNII